MPAFARLAATALAALIALPAAAFDIGAMTPTEQAIFRGEVRAYLLENPEVILEAIAALEAQELAEQAVDDAALVAVNSDALFADPNSWVNGNLDGDVTLVEFIDYNCGFCKRAYPEIAQVLEIDGNVRLVVKELPILGPSSELAARMTIAVLQTEGTEAYGRIHDALMTLRGELNAATLQRVAQEQGLDVAALTERMNSPEVAQVIAANRDLAARLRLNGTPSYAMGDRIIRGMLPATAMLDMVGTVRAEN
jgi:protein-disulfide isomerase